MMPAKIIYGESQNIINDKWLYNISNILRVIALSARCGPPAAPSGNGQELQC